MIFNLSNQLTSQIQNHGGEEEERIVSGLSALLLGICAIDNDGSVKDYTRFVNLYH